LHLPKLIGLSTDLGVFGSVAIRWMALDIYFFNDYLVFGLGAVMDRGSQILQNIPSKYG
jgi:hypothetical protein